MQPAWRAGEEPDNRLQSATMQPAWRAGEEPDNGLQSATMQPAWRPGQPRLSPVVIKTAPPYDGAGPRAGRWLSPAKMPDGPSNGVRLLRLNMV